MTFCVHSKDIIKVQSDNLDYRDKENAEEMNSQIWNTDRTEGWVDVRK